RRRLCNASQEHGPPAGGHDPHVLCRNRPGARVSSQLRNRTPGPQTRQFADHVPGTHKADGLRLVQNRPDEHDHQPVRGPHREGHQGVPGQAG
ncbi:hypothetical protein FKM82_027524, partial [Ascaphus truei]